jgi:hypothetical protein
MHQTVEHEATPQIQGMIRVVHHLVQVENAWFQINPNLIIQNSWRVLTNMNFYIEYISNGT